MADLKINPKTIEGALKNCTREDQVEEVFRRFEIIDPMEKRELLEKTMRVKKIFSSPKRTTDPDTLYKQRLHTFLNGNWRFF